ncbi:hypothetical protein [Shewanella sp. KCT]|uniref:hypothetical protein n=1 Tax=Shewanella sp. KCT TaxID=2569535 RepID=UPI0011846050|nr:hypothetical protein [Shewanella sp. KCT]
MALLDKHKLSSLLEAVSEQNSHKIGGKASEEEVAMFWLVCKFLSSKGKTFKAFLFPVEKGRANNVDSPFTLLSSTSNVVKLYFNVERIEDSSVRKTTGIQITFNSSDDVIDEVLGYKLTEIQQASPHTYWIDL